MDRKQPLRLSAVFAEMMASCPGQVRCAYNRAATSGYYLYWSAPRWRLSLKPDVVRPQRFSFIAPVCAAACSSYQLSAHIVCGLRLGRSVCQHCGHPRTPCLCVGSASRRTNTHANPPTAPPTHPIPGVRRAHPAALQVTAYGLCVKARVQDGSLVRDACAPEFSAMKQCALASLSRLRAARRKV